MDRLLREDPFTDLEEEVQDRASRLDEDEVEPTLPAPDVGPDNCVPADDPLPLTDSPSQMGGEPQGDPGDAGDSSEVSDAGDEVISVPVMHSEGEVQARKAAGCGQNGPAQPLGRNPSSRPRGLRIPPSRLMCVSSETSSSRGGRDVTPLERSIAHACM